MTLRTSLFLGVEAGQAKAELRSLQGEITKTGSSVNVLAKASTTAASQAARFDLATSKASTSVAAMSVFLNKATVDTAALARELLHSQQEAHQHAAAMDEIRARFNPLFAASKQYEAVLEQIAHAERLGAISAREAAAAREVAAGGLGRLASPIGLVSAGSGSAANNLRQVSLQLSQVGQQTIASGNSLQALAIQLPDIGLMFGTVGIAAGLLAGVALALVASWFTSTAEEAVSLDDAMGTLSQSMDRYQDLTKLSATSTAKLAEKFGSFAGQVRGFAEYTQGISLGQVLRDMDAAIVPLKGNLGEVVEALRRVQTAKANVSKTELMVSQGLAGAEQVLNQTEALDLLQAGADDAAAAMGLLPEQAAALSSALDDLGNASGIAQIRDEASQALALIQQWYPAGAALPLELAAAATALNDIVTRSAEAVSSAGDLASASALVHDVLSSITEIDLGSVFSNASGPANRLLAIAGALAGRIASMAGSYAEYGPFGVITGTDQPRGKFSHGGVDAVARAEALRRPSTLPIGTYGREASVSGSGKSGGAGAGAAKAETDAVADLIKKLRDEQQLLLETDPVQRELIKHREVLAKASTAERAEIEQLIGTEVRLKQAREEAQLFGRESLSFIQELSRSGGSAAAAIDKLAASLADAAIQALFLGEGPLSGVLGPAGGIFGAVFAGLGGGTGGAAAPSFPSLYADGGMIYGDGGGRADKVPVWMSPGEFAVNARSTARYRPVLERINAGQDIPGFANGGIIGGSPSAPGIFSGGGSAAPAPDNRPVINVINQSKAPVTGEVQETTDSRGQRQYRLVLSDAVAEAITTPGGSADKAMRAKYRGLRRGGINR